jgi:alkylation response protein AidB-like acyl-CoA dehydrogenase
MPRAHAQVIGRTLAKYGAGPPLKYFTGLNHAGPTVLDCGNDDQRARFLPPLARGDEIWCQLFSEPGAGSDLAGVATRARRERDAWIITGQKVWTSYARQSDYAILLARSDPDKPKHQGLTFFILDMRLPGIEVRPIRQITGMAEFNQVFLDEVVVLDSMRVGEVDNSTMLSERSGLGEQPGETADVAARLLARVAADPETEPAVLDQAVSLRLREIALNLVMARAAHDARAGAPGPEGSIGKVCRSELSQAVSELGVAAAGVNGLDWRSRDMGSPPAALLVTRAATVAGGSSEMQRNIIGERVLGLPKDPGVDPRTPWRDLRRS